MKHYFNLKKQGHLHVQRNTLLALVGLSLLINIILSTALLFKKERIIIMPPDLKKTYWIEGNKFSPSYLEEWSLEIAHLFLDVTAASIDSFGTIILRHVVPEAYGAIKKQLMNDEKRLKKEQLSTHFYPHQVSINSKKLSAEITGDLASYIADKKIDQHRETYHLQFQQQSGKLLIESFTLLKTNKPEEQSHD